MKTAAIITMIKEEITVCEKDVMVLMAKLDTLKGIVRKAEEGDDDDNGN